MKKILSKFKFKEIHIFWTCLIFGLFLIYFIFIKQNFIKNLDQKITFIIASFGVLFSILQFWYNSLRHRNDFLRNMGYEEYKRILEEPEKITKSQHHCPDYRVADDDLEDQIAGCFTIIPGRARQNDPLPCDDLYRSIAFQDKDFEFIQAVRRSFPCD